MTIQIYHNPRCSKSRQALQILIDSNIDPEIIEYLKNPPTRSDIENIITILNVVPSAILRKKDALYKEAGFDKADLSDSQILDLIVSNPAIIERPIVVNGKKAAIGRPPENILKII